MPQVVRRDRLSVAYLSDDGSTPSMTGDTARDSESYIAWPVTCPLAHACTRSTIGIYDPVFHITPLCIRCKPILARDGIVAVIGRMTTLGNRVSIYRIGTQQLLYACIHSL